MIVFQLSLQQTTLLGFFLTQVAAANNHGYKEKEAKKCPKDSRPTT
jgi:hypothetical protein